MKFAIKSVIVWPQTRKKKPRVVEFAPDKLNILTGPSRSGKSAVLWIIDHCLGASHCHIPTGKIRDNALSFGLVVDMGNLDVLVARDLHNNASFISPCHEIPQVPPEPNISVSNLKQMFDTRTGLPFMSLDEDVARPGFRDMMAFCLQPQHIVANPYTLFYRTDRSKYRERLQRLMPFVLQIDTVKDIAMKLRLERIEFELRRLRHERELAEESAVSDLGRLRGFVQKATELGLLGRDDMNVILESDEVTVYIEALGEVADKTRKELPRLSPADQNKVTETLSKVSTEYDKIETELRAMKRKRGRLLEFSATAGSYGEQVGEVNSRLASAGWFSDRLARAVDCPFCGERGNWSKAKVAELLELADAADLISRSWKAKPATLDKEIVAVDDQISVLIVQQEALKKQLHETKEWRQESERIFEAYRFLGYIDMYLSAHKRLNPSGTFIQKIHTLEEERDSIRRRVHGRARRRRGAEMLHNLEQMISHYSRALRLERAEQRITLDLKELTLRFSDEKEEEGVLLADVGSGANHMGYHAAALFALHEFFIRYESPVPSFLVMDQPSQVFFPHNWPDEGARGEKEVEAIENMKMLFSVATRDFLEKSLGQMQLIVLDHVGAETWEHVQGVKIVEDERWWEGDRLIPEHWGD